MYVPNSAEGDYQLDLNIKDKGKPLEVANVYHPNQVEDHKIIKYFGKDGYIFHKIDKLIIITYKSIKNFNP